MYKYHKICRVPKSCSKQEVVNINGNKGIYIQRGVSKSGDQYSSSGIICNMSQTVYNILTAWDQ